MKTVSVAAMVTTLTTRALDERSRGDYLAIARGGGSYRRSSFHDGRRMPMSSRGTFLCALVIAAGMLAHPSPSAADYPIFFQRYTADPGTLEWNGRLYLYASHDLDDQTSYQMFDITCISTDDLKNWTDHGECFNARTGSSWAQLSWGPPGGAPNNQFYNNHGHRGGR